MRKLVLHRWALVILLLSRLVLGEFSHAMPMAGMTHEPAQISMADACADHEAAPDSHHDAAPGDAGEHNCCKAGECKCPCLHVPAASFDSFATTIILPDLQQPDEGAQGLMLRRLSGLFRPPA